MNTTDSDNPTKEERIAVKKMAAYWRSICKSEARLTENAHNLLINAFSNLLHEWSKKNENLSDKPM